MSIGNRIKKVRTNSGENQEQFAKKIGLNRSSISLLESDKINPAENTLKLICTTYNVRYAWLKNGEGEIYETSGEIEDLISSMLISDSSAKKVFTAAAKSFTAKDWDNLLELLKKLSKNL